MGKYFSSACKFINEINHICYSINQDGEFENFHIIKSILSGQTRIVRNHEKNNKKNSKF